MAATAEDPKKHLSSLKRGLAVLRLLNLREIVSASQIAKELNLPRTTAQRILETLVSEGCAEKVPYTVNYRLTPDVFRLSNQFCDGNWIAHVGSRPLFAKTQEIGWPLGIATQSGEDMVLRVSTDKVAPKAIDHFVLGFRTPIMHATSGHVILAFQPSEARKETLALLRQSSDPRQRLSRDEQLVNFVLERTRQRGFAHVVYQEYPEASVGVPLFIDGELKACLLMTYAKRALSEALIAREFAPMLIELADGIGEQVSRLKAQRLTASADPGGAAQADRPTAPTRLRPRPNGEVSYAAGRSLQTL
jgi:IclR family mhp operon transcriptional activator